MVSRQPARPATGKAVLSVGFVLTNNFTLTALSSFLDALRLAADDGDGSRPIRCHWKILGARKLPAPSSCGIAIAPDHAFGDPGGFDYIVVVGGLLHRGPQIDAEPRLFSEGNSNERPLRSSRPAVRNLTSHSSRLVAHLC